MASMGKRYEITWHITLTRLQSSSFYNVSIIVVGENEGLLVDDS